MSEFHVEPKQIRVMQASIVNCVTPGKELALNIEQNHTVSEIAPGLCSTSSQMVVTRQNDDAAEPFKIIIDIKSLFAMSGSISSDCLFNETARFLQPKFQEVLDKLSVIVGPLQIKLPQNSAPKAQNSQ